jgi:hypothetical protein
MLEFEIDPASVTLNGLAAQWMNLDGTGAKLAGLVSGLKFRTARRLRMVAGGVEFFSRYEGCP